MVFVVVVFFAFISYLRTRPTPDGLSARSVRDSGDNSTGINDMTAASEAAVIPNLMMRSISFREGGHIHRPQGKVPTATSVTVVYQDFGWLLVFYILATSKVISGQALTCVSAHSRPLHSAARVGDQAMT